MSGTSVDNTKFTNFEIAKWLSEVAFKEFYNKKNLVELCEYQNSSLWWSVLSDLSLTINGKSISFSSSIIPKEVKSTYKKIFFIEPFINFIKKVLALIVYFIQPRNKENKKYKIMFFSLPKAWRAVYNLKDNKINYADVHYDSLIQELSKKKYNIEVISVSPILSLRNFYNIITTFKRAIHSNNLFLPLEMFWSMSVFRKQNTAIVDFRKKWIKLKENLKSNSSIFRYKNKSFYDSIYYQLEHFFNSHFASIVNNIHIMGNLFDKEKPDLIVLPNTGGWFWQSIMIAAKNSGCPVLTTQHAVIYPSNSHYYHSENSKVNTQGPLFSPLPPKFAVYGSWTKKLLTEKFNYPSSSSVITGQSRYDVISQPEKLFDRKKFCKLHNLDSNKKIVLFATVIPISPFIESELKIFRALKNIPELQIIVKPHPRGDSKKYEQIAKKEGLNVTIIHEDSSVFEPIFASDLVITLPSTVVTEAVMMSKPVLLVEFNNQKEEIPWVESGVALRVSEEKHAEEKIRLLLFNRNIIKKMFQSREKFVANHLYKLDGKSTERQVELVLRMIKNKDSNK